MDYWPATLTAKDKANEIFYELIFYHISLSSSKGQVSSCVEKINSLIWWYNAVNITEIAKIAISSQENVLLNSFTTEADIM